MPDYNTNPVSSTDRQSAIVFGSAHHPYRPPMLILEMLRYRVERDPETWNAYSYWRAERIDPKHPRPGIPRLREIYTYTSTNPKRDIAYELFAMEEPRETSSEIIHGCFHTMPYAQIRDLVQTAMPYDDRRRIICALLNETGKWLEGTNNLTAVIKCIGISAPEHSPSNDTHFKR